MKKFEGLLKSEIRKVERLANKLTGFSDCKVTAYSSMETHPINFDPSVVFVECDCEVCRNYEEPIGFSIHLTIPMFDRRRSWVKANR